MKKPFVFAGSITNLTDARYFAAMGVDYIGFELSDGHEDQVDIDFVKTVGDWLEGPAIIGCIEGTEHQNELTKWVVDGQLDGLFFHQKPDNNILEAFQSLQLFITILEIPVEPITAIAHKWVIEKADFSRWMKNPLPVVLQQLKQSNIFLTGDFDDVFFQSKLYKQAPGLILKGSEEEKVGFKSFEDLDEIFDHLEG